MFTPQKHKTPKSIDEAAELLMDDLGIDHVKALAGMTEAEFEFMYNEVSPILLDEFDLWLRNKELLDSCLEVGVEPALAILNLVREYCLLYVGR